jgi:hypothetical protein
LDCQVYPWEISKKDAMHDKEQNFNQTWTDPLKLDGEAIEIRRPRGC